MYLVKEYSSRLTGKTIKKEVTAGLKEDLLYIMQIFILCHLGNFEYRNYNKYGATYKVKNIPYIINFTLYRNRTAAGLK